MLLRYIPIPSYNCDLRFATCDLEVIGANVRESRSAQSDKDFLSKMEIALKEARETEYWLEIIIESELVEKSKFDSLLREANEINKILIASTRKLKDKINCQLSN